MTKNVITFLMSFGIHDISNLKAVRGLFELVGYYEDKQKIFYYVYYPDQQIHDTHTHTHTNTHTHIYIYINNILYNTRSSTCFNLSVSSSGNIILLFC